MYITLVEAKKHLNIEQDFHEDDTYILYLVEVAEAVVARYICQPLIDLEDPNHHIPAPLKHAAMLYMGDLYANRESNSFGVNVSQVPFTFQFLCDAYRCYADVTSDQFTQECLDDICSRMYVNGDGNLIIKSSEDMYQGARGKALKRIEQNFIQNGGRLYNVTSI